MHRRRVQAWDHACRLPLCAICCRNVVRPRVAGSREAVGDDISLDRGAGAHPCFYARAGLQALQVRCLPPPAVLCLHAGHETEHSTSFDVQIGSNTGHVYMLIVSQACGGKKACCQPSARRQLCCLTFAKCVNITGWLTSNCKAEMRVQS